MNTCVAVIRDRNQLTIPDKIRQQLGWIGPRQVVCFWIEGKDKLVIKPYRPDDFNDKKREK